MEVVLLEACIIVEAIYAHYKVQKQILQLYRKKSILCFLVDIDRTILQLDIITQYLSVNNTLSPCSNTS